MKVLSMVSRQVSKTYTGDVTETLEGLAQCLATVCLRHWSTSVAIF